MRGIIGKIADIDFNRIYKWGGVDSLSDEKFKKIKYRIKMGQKLDLNNPKKFSEKLQWIKLYDRKPEYTKFS